MKHNKTVFKFIKTFVLALLAICLACGFAACSNKDGEEHFDKATVIVKNGEAVYTEEINLSYFESGDTLLDVFNSEQYKNVFNLQSSEMGGYISLDGLHGVVPNAENFEYLASYTTLRSFSDSDDKVTVAGYECYYANKGFAEITLEKDAVYIFNLENWA